MSKSKKSSFPCTMCGACCRRIDKVVLRLDDNSPDNELHFPYKWDETGRCEKLTKNNKCSVYKNRPLICNIDKLMLKYWMPKEQFYFLNIVACNTMMDEDNLPAKYRIK